MEGKCSNSIYLMNELQYFVSYGKNAGNEASYWIIWLRNTQHCILLSAAAPLVSELTLCSCPLKLFPFLRESLVGLNKKRCGFWAGTTVPSWATLWPPSSGHFACLNNNCCIWESIVRTISYNTMVSPKHSPLPYHCCCLEVHHDSDQDTTRVVR